MTGYMECKVYFSKVTGDTFLLAKIHVISM
jgi:hypothetical protein